MAEGRAVFKLMKTPQIVGGEDEKAIMRTQIGSSPPRCERRCNNCGHCEAVQVPATPQDKNKIIHFSTVSLRGEYSSNYKPMSWKCKCGDFIFNP
ncbi:hypothetical protein GIB67_015281 [Kingdonia uniflora]|uniref:Epidermal patterning factor-like protein n=1 Tax=Kingdonia uniflora TaxID=39325 RepID=A0A7J7MST1_9MAGN|nr:hypothetical protein GIB67_015281 [Kingdonia uniflora]